MTFTSAAIKEFPNSKTTLPERLDENTLVWKKTISSGHSTPSIHGDRIFLTTYREAEQELATVALDRETGNQLWKQVAPTTRIEPVHQVGSPPSATPACDGQRVYVFFGSYGLLCYDLEGNLVWSKPMEPFQDEFGSSSSPHPDWRQSSSERGSRHQQFPDRRQQI